MINPIIKKTGILALLLLAGATSLRAEDKAAYQARMKWWNDDRLGMFIHWGVYSTYGGEYNGVDHGKEMGGTSAEWIYLKANIPQEEYREAARRFNPKKFDANEWVRIAKENGIKYMVLTAKHHDGFAMFDSKVSDWNAVQASGIKEDLIKKYVDACHAQGMRVGFYYSHEKDWFNHERAQKSYGPLPEKYRALAKAQIKELLTQYGKIDLIWFDTPMKEHEAFNRECAALVRELQPECIINGRIGSGLGDYKNIGDRAIVDPGNAGYMESIMTMRLNWGYDRNDNFWKSSRDLITMVSKCACRGSNFLLNIGPTPEGLFTPEDQVRLHDLGVWLKSNGAAIYGTQGSPFGKEYPWGSLTINPKERTIYLHLWNWKNGPITVPGLKSNVLEATFLDTNEKLETQANSEQAALTILLPNTGATDTVRIVRLKLQGDPEFDKDHGPRFVDQKVQHLTRLQIKGEVVDQNDTTFTVKGHRHVSNEKDYSVYEDKESIQSLCLNDHVRYRINDKGDIRSVQGFELQKGKVYSFVYTPFEGNPELEIITEIR